ncbi:hypothetical protein [Paracoccus aminophilus]|uniref:hypothetical protein n=1 Tax=Paracoccus aminophilus TaxID=34003 RepID=UPI00040A3F2B|nr:hypothetical protein [Paracoccus aminophilus]
MAVLMRAGSVKKHEVLFCLGAAGWRQISMKTARSRGTRKRGASGDQSRPIKLFIATVSCQSARSAAFIGPSQASAAISADCRENRRHNGQIIAEPVGLAQISQNRQTHETFAR